MVHAEGDYNAFGLTFRQYDTRQMQHILRAYSRLPTTPNVRSVLYLALTSLENSLDDEEAHGIRDWLQAGGVLSDFPGPSTAQGPPVNGDELRATTGRQYENLEEGNERLEDPWGPPQLSFGRQTGRLVGGEFANFRPGMYRPFPEAGHHDVDHFRHGSHPNTVEPLRQGTSPQHERYFGDEDETFDTDLEDYDSEAYLNMDDRGRASQGNGVENGATTTSGFAASSSHTQIVPPDWKECLICVCSYSPEHFPDSLKITSTCAHENEEIVCIRCIRMAIQTALREGDLHRIVCPLCPEPLSEEEIKKYGTKENFSRYQYLVLMATPGLVMCLGPNCGSGQVHEEKADNPIMVCDSCAFKTCVVHKLPWHEGFTCEQFDCDESQIERLEADEATAKLLSQNSKVCPSCNQGVTKTDGCDHLQCRCGQEWCFICLASWENIMRIGETAHARTCLYHPDKVRLRADQKNASAQHMAELVHGGPVSEALEKARIERNEKRREALRPLAAEAAEKRMQAMRRPQGPDAPAPPAKRNRPKLAPAWEER